MSEDAPVSRRRFLGAGALAGALAVATGACTDGDDEGGPAAGGGGSAGADRDVEVAAFAAGVEVLAVDTYTAALDAATTGTLGQVPPAVTELLTTVKAHHEAHLAAWNDFLEDKDEPAVRSPNGGLKPAIDSALGNATDSRHALALARRLEETAAATYLSAVPHLTSPQAVQLAASIQAVDAKHVAILSFLLGEYPVPDVYAKTDKAART